MDAKRFPFAFDRRFRVPLRLLGVRTGNAAVLVVDDELRVLFGRWRLRTPLSNVAGVEISEDYRWFRVIGIRFSLADHGATLGTNPDAGACIRFHEPVALLFGDRLPHPGVTVTVDDPRALEAAIDARATGSAR